MINIFNYNPFKSLIGFVSTKKKECYTRPKLEEFITPIDKKEIMNFKGTITSLNRGQGTVNNFIYFSESNFPYFDCSIGKSVEGLACRINSKSAWRIKNMNNLTEDWEEEHPIAQQLKEPTSEVFVGKVTFVCLDELQVNKEYSFGFDSNSVSFQIIEGDWVVCQKSMEVNEIEDNSKQVYSVKPLRTKIVQGFITHIHTSGFYIINNEIFCKKTLFDVQRKLQDAVIVKVIESDQNKFSWRAIWAKINSSKDLGLSSEPDLDDIKNKFIAKSKDVPSQPSIPCGLLLDTNFEKTVNEVTVSVDIGTQTNSFEINSTEFIPIKIFNESSSEVKSLNNIWLVQAGYEVCAITIDKYLMQELPYVIKPLKNLNIFLECRCMALGSIRIICVLDIDDNKIGRNIDVSVKNSSKKHKIGISNSVKNIDPISTSQIIRGEKPVHASPFIPVKLPMANIPTKLCNAVNNSKYLAEEFPVLNDPLNIYNYVEKFSILLHLEEIELERQMRQFDIPLASFDRHGEYLALTVEGLAEKRPSLLVGDYVLASDPYSNDEVQYEGYIHEILHSKVANGSNITLPDQQENTHTVIFQSAFSPNLTQHIRRKRTLKNVLLKFNFEFHTFYNDEDYAIRLCFNRTPLRRNHMAISHVVTQLCKTVLFPSQLKFQLPQVSFVESENFISPQKQHLISNECKETLKTKSCSTKVKVDKSGYCLPIRNNKQDNKNKNCLKWFDEKLNSEQKLAVKRILDGSTRPLPYIIFGPPGTGKTVTIVESILQVYSMVPHSRILVVTPSNSASDLVAERTIRSGKLKSGECIRINSFNRSPDSISEFLVDHCHDMSELTSLVRHRIIVSTAINAGVLYTARLKNGHFTHVFVDEAGQLTEPETAISLGLVNNVSGQIVLAGDPKQLGPVVISSLAKKFDLGQSLLHRLCQSVLYQPRNSRLQSVYTEEEVPISGNDLPSNDTIETPDDSMSFEPSLVTLLVRNYRSHPDLLVVPSNLFYNSSLVSCASLDIRDRMSSWAELPVQSCPLIFHAVKGENQQEGDSPSWFNAAEVFQVCRYACSLLNHGLESDEIGIVTPYKKQVQKIRLLLAAMNIGSGIKVGPVEEFQGQERVAIIVSTVRSSEDILQDDLTHSLGFVRCAQRFNVAITRAMSVLVIVGNPILLNWDPNWKHLITYCMTKGVMKS